MLTEAILFATEKHRGTTRRNSTLPYIVHPLEVMHLLLRVGVRDEATLVAAVLHDVVEDCGVKPAEIEERFGATVRELVMALTKPDEAPGRDVKAEALEQVRRGPEAARAVKMADRLSNLRDMHQTNWTRAKKGKYLVEAEEILRIGRGALPELADELEAMVARQRGLLPPA